MTPIAAIMPCRGRPEQTVRNVQRLLRTAGRAEWGLWLVVDDDHALVREVLAAGFGDGVHLLAREHRGGYWQCLRHATEDTNASLLVNLANDLLPGLHWLERGRAAYRARFGGGDGLMGFNDGIQGPEHSPHFIVSRGLLARYGGWPVWYSHNYGDTELCLRAQQDRCYGKAPWAVLYHDHELTGAGHDTVYAEGAITSDRDRALFENRRRQGWPTTH